MRNIMRHRLLDRVVLAWIILVILIALIGDVSVAQTDGGRTAADFLLIGTGARSAGLGGAYTAVSAGAEATYWNPAGLAGMAEHEVTLGHFSLFQDISLEHGAFAYSANENTAVATSITYLSYGTIEGYDINGSSTGELSAYDLAFALSVGHNVTDDLALGITGKFISQHLDDVSGSGVAADLGVRYQMKNVTLAAVACNLGSGVKYDAVTEKLPFTSRISVAVTPFGNSFMTALELEKRSHTALEMRHGVEVNFSHQYYLRTGYNLSLNPDKEFRSPGLSMGAGVRFGEIVVDYAYTLKDKYSSQDIHRFSMAFRF
jgi:hypothetical protein